MGNSLHNKIHLGRPSLLSSGRVRAALVLGAMAVASLAWLAVRALRG
ncbi:hypothetical protein [Massilia glaciei]|nr:hypothetical protein [Massilia glaciei]